MITTRVYNDIANEKDDFMCFFGGEASVFSAATLKNIFENNPNETDFTFNFNCDGGSVSEGLAIYDIMRTSGKNIYCNIDGGCHSIAVVMLLAAPFENRTANPHATALLHRVGGYAGFIDADDAAAISADMRNAENQILNIYADRTGNQVESMRALMNAERERTANELLTLGFISKINEYNTNFKNKRMAIKKPITNKAESFLKRLANALRPLVNYDYADAEGNTVFSTEGEEDTLAVGDVVTFPESAVDAEGNPITGGTFTLEDGRVVTIVDNVVTEIAEAAGDELANANARIAELEALLNEASEVITELKNQAVSNYTPPVRKTVPATRGASAQNGRAKTAEQLKQEANEKREVFKNGKPVGGKGGK